jgi:hypothetical protein
LSGGFRGEDGGEEQCEHGEVVARHVSPGVWRVYSLAGI